MTASGALHFGRYAFPPNRLGYCGPADAGALLQRLAEGCADRGLVELGRRFEGAFPYLRLIAASNHIEDPFDERVVEAYWTGNELLRRVEARSFHDSLEDRFKARMSGPAFGWLTGTLEAGAVPHHNFHVLEIYRRAGMAGDDRREPLLSVMDSCRISWGRVTEVTATKLAVARPPLVLRGHRLELGAPEAMAVEREAGGVGYTPGIRAGDWISIHWGWACEILSRRSLAQLQAATEGAVQRANLTL